MSKSIKALTLIGLVALAAACAQQDDEVVIMEPAPIMAEPVTGKY